MNLENYTDEELLRFCITRSLTILEKELAKRLQISLDEMEVLCDEVRSCGCDNQC